MQAKIDNVNYNFKNRKKKLKLKRNNIIDLYNDYTKTKNITVRFHNGDETIERLMVISEVELESDTYKDMLVIRLFDYHNI